ncbi:TPA: hypothetical protein DCZ15_03230 [Candidatus Falkowbacteria bacterium]|nr:hypothetical protein [Candidatus Falkowbacteria bacterium]
MLFAVFALISCGHDSGRLIGSFRVISKQKTNPDQDYGFVTLSSQYDDTVRVFVSSEENYLNIKEGDSYLVGQDRFDAFFLNVRIERGVVGYQRVLGKFIDGDGVKCQVLTRGNDTICVLVSNLVYYNVSAGDSIFVKKNRSKDAPRYYAQ